MLSHPYFLPKPLENLWLIGSSWCSDNCFLVILGNLVASWYIPIATLPFESPSVDHFVLLVFYYLLHSVCELKIYCLLRVMLRDIITF